MGARAGEVRGPPPVSEGLSVRVVSLDWVHVSPVADLDREAAVAFDRRGASRVPVVRVFGSTPRGQTCCVHVHGQLPYLYAQVPSEVLAGPSDGRAAAGQGPGAECDPGVAFAERFALELERALVLGDVQLAALRGAGAGATRREKQYVASARPVVARDIYGAHEGQAVFLKVSLFEPTAVARAAELLRSGAVLKHPFLCMEAHIPYLLQFLVDNGLSGMGYMTAVRAAFRRPLPVLARERLGEGPGEGRRRDSLGTTGSGASTWSQGASTREWVDGQGMPDGFSLWPEEERGEGSERHSTCDVEADTTVADLVPEFVEAAEAWDERGARGVELARTAAKARMVPSLELIWREERRRRRAAGLPPEPAMPGAVARDANASQPRYLERRFLAGLSALVDQLDSQPVRREGGSEGWGVDAYGHDRRREGSELARRLTQDQSGVGGVDAEAEEVILSCTRRLSMSQSQRRESAGLATPSQDTAGRLLVDLLLGVEADGDGYASDDAMGATQADGFERDLLHLAAQAVEDVEEDFIGGLEGEEGDQRLDGGARPSLSQRLSLSLSQGWSQGEQSQGEGRHRSCGEQFLRRSSLLAEIERFNSQREVNDIEETGGEDVSDADEAEREVLDLSNEEDDEIEHEISRLEGGADATLAPNPRARGGEGEGPLQPGWYDGAFPPPRLESLLASPEGFDAFFEADKPGAAMHIHLPVHYSDPADAPKKPNVVLGVQRNVPILNPRRMLKWRAEGGDGDVLTADSDSDVAEEELAPGWYEPCKPPPAHADTLAWVAKRRSALAQPRSVENKMPKPGGGRRVSFSMDANSGAAIANHGDASDGGSVRIDSLSGDSSDGLSEKESDGSDDDDPQASQRKRRRRSAVSNELKNQAVAEGEDSDGRGPPSPKYDETFFASDKGYFLDAPGDGRPASKTPPPRLQLPLGAKLVRNMGELPDLEGHLSQGRLSEGMFVATSQQTSSTTDVPSHAPVSPLAVTGTVTATVDGTRSSDDGLNARHGGGNLPSHLSGPTEGNAPPSDGGAPVEYRLDQSSTQGGALLTLMSVEIHATCRGEKRPDPAQDPVAAVCFTVRTDYRVSCSSADGSGFATPTEQQRGFDYQGLFCVVDEGGTGLEETGRGPRADLMGLRGCEINLVHSETDLLRGFAKRVREVDPDVLLGWEVQSGSIGYLHERVEHLNMPLVPDDEGGEQDKRASGVSGAAPGPEAVGLKERFQKHKNQFRLLREISRTPGRPGATEWREDAWGADHASGIAVAGRIVLNLWRVLQSEVKLNNYSFEACVYGVLGRRVPHHPFSALTVWFAGDLRWRTLKYLLDRSHMNLLLMDSLDLVGRTAELARVFGIDFYSVISRGSQYRVESMLVRLAHKCGCLLYSPGAERVRLQPAMEALPLVMEPESRFYASPVIVLDFQSLYPSVVIAHNLCFSTMLGKIPDGNKEHQAVDLERARVLGASELRVPAERWADLHRRGFVHVAPNGSAFLTADARMGVLPQLLREILETRVMIKTAMKAEAVQADRVLHRVLNARQFGLKMIANVTYGYTAAGFSGRMPCAELADAIVQHGREALEDAIKLVESNSQWRAKVVYGDTDSLFVHVPGRSRAEAFAIGKEIAAAVSSGHPAPIELKMDKVYHPCILQTKKRYVGYSYDSPTQVDPTFDAKGIETVRRDGCGAVRKTLEQSLRILFESKDLSRVKRYLYRQWSRIIVGKLPLDDFIFAQEVRLGTYAGGKYASTLPPAARVAQMQADSDPRATAKHNERVPYVVVAGHKGDRVKDLVVPPLALMAPGSTHRLNSTYYIVKQIVPALQRCFSLVGADIEHWYRDMPRPAPGTYFAARSASPSFGVSGGGTTFGGVGVLGMKRAKPIEGYFLSRSCLCCGTAALDALCPACMADPQASLVSLRARALALSKAHARLVTLCSHCSGATLAHNRGDGGAAGIQCDSTDCPILCERLSLRQAMPEVAEIEDACRSLA